MIQAVQLDVRVDHLLSVLAIVEHGTLRRAAEALRTSQPALSRTLREVERILDVRLFDRGPRGVTPTRFGRAVARHAAVIRAEAQRTLLDLDALRDADSEPLRLGVVPVIPAPLVSQAITATRQAHPGTVIRMEARPQRELLERLAAGHVDLVLGPLSDLDDPTPRFATRAIFRDELCVVARRTHPLARRRGPVTLADLAGWGWLLPPIGSRDRTDVDRAFRRKGLTTPTPQLESEDVPFQLYTISTSDPLGVVTRSQASYGAPFGLRVLDVDLGAAPTEIGVIHSPHSPLPDAARTLVESLREAATRSAR